MTDEATWQPAKNYRRPVSKVVHRPGVVLNDRKYWYVEIHVNGFTYRTDGYDDEKTAKGLHDYIASFEAAYNAQEQELERLQQQAALADKAYQLCQKILALMEPPVTMIPGWEDWLAEYEALQQQGDQA